MDKMKYLITAFIGLIAIIFLNLKSFNYTDNLKLQIVNLSLDIQESRRREEILGEYIKNIDYEVDVLAGSLRKE